MGNLGFRAIRDFRRPERELVELVGRWRSTDLADAMNGSGTMLGIAPLYRPIRRIAGPAVTISVPGGGLNMVKLGVSTSRAGDVLVVTAQGSSATALWGGGLSIGLRARGVLGAIFDGAVRDSSEIKELDLPIFARAIATSIGDPEAARGEINFPIACGGVVVTPGDIVVADEDGIAVVPPAFAREVAAQAALVDTRHRSLEPLLETGEVTSLEELTAKLVARGLTFE